MNNEMKNQTKIHISDVREGDTVIHEGELRTVSSRDIRFSEFMGITVFGDSYRLGYRPVTLVDLAEMNECSGCNNMHGHPCPHHG